MPQGTAFDLISALEFRSAFTRPAVLAAGARWEGNVDTSVPGIYPVKVAVRDPATKLITIKVFKIRVLPR